MISYDWTINARDLDFIVTLSLKMPEAKKAQRKGMLAFGLIAALCFLLVAQSLLLYRAPDSTGTGGIALLGLLGLMSFLRCVLLPVTRKLAARRSLWQRDPRLLSGTRHIEIREDGLAISSVFGSSLKFWNSFRCWGTGEGYLFLMDLSGSCVLIDRSSIPESDLQEIENLLRSQQVLYADLF